MKHEVVETTCAFKIIGAEWVEHYDSLGFNMLLIKIVENSYNALNVISDNFMYDQSIKTTPGSRC